MRQSRQAGVRWQVPDGDALLWESWGSEFSLFDRNTGDTHLVNELPAEVIRHLTREPISATGLAESIAKDCEIECTHAWQQKVESILINLEALSLVEPVAE